MCFIVAAAAVFLALPLGAGAGEIEGGKLIGIWELTKVEGQATAPHWRIEFLKDGKLRMISKRDGKEYKVEGTHGLKGNKFTLTVVEDRKTTDTKTVTVKELTDDTLVFLDNNKRMEFERAK